jgi:flagellar basal-body rod modification protein FlgD
MTAVSALSGSTASTTSQPDSGGLQDVNVDQFLKLMIAELQNQDPLQPMENSEMLQQLSQMRSIGATDKLTNTLDAVLVGQNLTTASSLIGKQVNALTDAGSNVQGTVDRVTVEPADDGSSGTVRIHIGQDSIALQNVREILPVTTP